MRTLCCLGALIIITGTLAGCECTLESGRTIPSGESATCDDGCNTCSCEAGAMSTTDMWCELGALEATCGSPNGSDCSRVANLDGKCQDTSAEASFVTMHFCPTNDETVCPAAGCALAYHIEGEPASFWCCP